MFSFQEVESYKVGVAMTDLSTGLYAHGAIMAAILQRQRTGQGQHIDCDLFSTQVSWSLEQLMIFVIFRKGLLIQVFM